ncbi:MAG TPA: MAPEG family protein [Devosia sp.]|nr:MAPEG family protein [Devosia sp.]
MIFQITALYAAIFTVFVVVLANVVSAQRARAKVSILHGDDMKLALWMRRHGNLVENVPLALILMGLCEANGLPGPWLHAMGIVLIVGRLAHVVGLNATNPAAPLRIAGGMLTQAAMLGAAGFLVVGYF